MIADQEPPPPDNEKLWIYSIFVAIFRAVCRPAKLRELLRVWGFCFVSTEVPPVLNRSCLGASHVRAGIYAAIITFFFTFVVTGAVAHFDGTFKAAPGDVGDRVYFLDDVHNLILYTIVCPGYVAFGVSLVVAMLGGAGKIKSLKSDVSSISRSANRISIPIAVILILLISVLGTAQYISDVLDSERVRDVYWFVGFDGAGGERVSAITVYYAILNFVLLFLTMVFVAAFLSGLSYALDVAAALSNAGSEVELRFDELLVKLETFTVVYFCAKALVFLYMLNFYIWADSPLNKSDNVLIAQIAITVIGVFIVSFPRYAIEYEWHLYKWRSGHYSGSDLKHDDIRPLSVRVWAWVFDGLLIGGFVVTVWVSPNLAPLFK